LVEVLPADEAASEGEERFVDVVAAVSADQEAAAVVEPGEGALNDPALVSAFLSRETRAHPLSRNSGYSQAWLSGDTLLEPGNAFFKP
jgi:hypothetical protein